MFTGIVSQVGTIESVESTPSGQRLVLSADGLGDLLEGASIAVNGVCLTAIKPKHGSVALDLIPETLSRTSLGAVSEGSKVNLELAMPASGRFDGHIVQGHVDGAGTVSSIDHGDDGGVVMTITLPADLGAYVVEKGSITVDGVSLTVASVGEDTFTVALIPHTLQVTTLGLRNEGDLVNLETDVLAKYVERLLKVQE